MTSIIVRTTCRNAAEDQPTVSTLMQGMSSAAKVFLVAATESSTSIPRQASSDHRGGNAFAVRVLGRVAHAEIESEPGQKNAREVPLPQISGKTGRRFAGKMSEHADELEPGLIRRPQHRGGRQDSAGL